MKIKEITRRDCCQPQDFKSYKGVNHTGKQMEFCIHRGQLRIELMKYDSHGNPDYIWEIVRGHSDALILRK